MAIEVAVQHEVERLHARYADAIDEDRLEEWPGFFVPGGRYRIATAENEERGLPLPVLSAESRAMMQDRVASLRHANIYEPQRYRHVLSQSIVVRVDAARVRSVANFLVMRILQDGESTLFASGRYLDTILLEGEGGEPQYEERVVVCDSRRFDTLLAIPL
ncbi:MAG TPA: aromatic-ring-hydroxylating dioxygenase subunit beta [Burkholderiales bacterium]|jgi:3-phenylpropionate/cinnamic acid dioxygenase small subunit|nr:aromatic-ring-hydroxylating dioxygenase subunit beta [Burkholderiales bacterium]